METIVCDVVKIELARIRESVVRLSAIRGVPSVGRALQGLEAAEYWLARGDPAPQAA